MKAVHVDDITWISALHCAVFPRGWSAQEFQELLAAGAFGWQEETAGFILLRSAAQECEILTLVTTPEKRRQGLASRLLQHSLHALPAQNVKTVFLEVQADNTAAQTLYCKHGFSEIARRPHYYALPDGSHADAVVMRYLIV